VAEGCAAPDADVPLVGLPMLLLLVAAPATELELLCSRAATSCPNVPPGPWMEVPELLCVVNIPVRADRL
jgi:hypothetical protein